MTNSIEERNPQQKPSSTLYVIIAFAIAAVVGFGAVAAYNGGLPGTKSSPTTSVNGQSTVGKTGS